MSPMLSKEQQPPPTHTYKFVRDGCAVAFDFPGEWFSQIATTHKLGTSLADGQVLVDDAGFFDKWPDGRYSVSIAPPLSSDCQLTGDLKEAREDTVKVISWITGEWVTSD